MPGMIRTSKEFRKIAENILKLKDRMYDKKRKPRKEKKTDVKKDNKENQDYT